MLLKSFKQLFNKPKTKSSAWDAAGFGRRLWERHIDCVFMKNMIK